MKKTMLLGCLAAWGALASPAFAADTKGSCWPLSGSAHVFSIDKTVEPENTPGEKEVSWNSAGHFQGICYCPDEYKANSILFRFSSDVLAANNAQRSGDYIYYPLPVSDPQDSGISIGFKVKIGGNVRDMVNIDLQNRDGIDNQQAHNQDCDENSSGYDFETGSTGNVSLKFAKKITGNIKYSGTLLTIHAKKNHPDSNFDDGKPFVKLHFNLDINVPPKCYINGGQNINIDFGKIASNKFKPDAAGREKEIDLKVSCDNTEDLKKVSIKFLATDFNQEGLIRTRSDTQEERKDLGIKLKHNAQKIDANSAAIPLEGDSVKITATPVQQGKTPPQVGHFNATSTLDLEFK